VPGVVVGDSQVQLVLVARAAFPDKEETKVNTVYRGRTVRHLLRGPMVSRPTVRGKLAGREA